MAGGAPDTGARGVFRASSYRALDAGVGCLQGVVWRARLLTHILEEAMRQEEQWSSMPITAADLSCSLLTRLEGMLHQYSLQGGPRGQCRHVLHCISLPMTELLYTANFTVLVITFKRLASFPLHGTDPSPTKHKGRMIVRTLHFPLHESC